MTNNYEDNDFREQEVLSEDEIKERQEKKRAKGQYYSYNKNDYYNGSKNNSYNNGNSNATNKGMTSLVLGIISLFCIFLGQASFIGSILAIVGLIMGVDARNNGDRTYAKTGIILNTIGLAATLLVTIACIACLSCVGCSIFNYAGRF
ncbi:DUF4190 domain-containing protein [Fenollaria timonensis]|uniref:DUF4190 domain-containing protein n=1 Tax=Fenollaria timonensis TaxID=1723384 RepID=UPI00071E266B|nr:DUF4190 domain-containing protein [Fenollaria timonensis]